MKTIWQSTQTFSSLNSVVVITSRDFYSMYHLEVTVPEHCQIQDNVVIILCQGEIKPERNEVGYNYTREAQKRKKSTLPLGLELIFAGEIVGIFSFIN